MSGIVKTLADVEGYISNHRDIMAIARPLVPIMEEDNAEVGWPSDQAEVGWLSDQAKEKTCMQHCGDNGWLSSLRVVQEDEEDEAERAWALAAGTGEGAAAVDLVQSIATGIDERPTTTSNVTLFSIDNEFDNANDALDIDAQSNASDRPTVEAQKSHDMILDLGRTKGGRAPLSLAADSPLSSAPVIESKSAASNIAAAPSASQSANRDSPNHINCHHTSSDPPVHVCALPPPLPTTLPAGSAHTSTSNPTGAECHGAQRDGFAVRGPLIQEDANESAHAAEIVPDHELPLHKRLHEADARCHGSVLSWLRAPAAKRRSQSVIGVCEIAVLVTQAVVLVSAMYCEYGDSLLAVDILCDVVLMVLVLWLTNIEQRVVNSAATVLLSLMLSIPSATIANLLDVPPLRLMRLAVPVHLFGTDAPVDTMVESVIYGMPKLFSFNGAIRHTLMLCITIFMVGCAELAIASTEAEPPHWLTARTAMQCSASGLGIDVFFHSFYWSVFLLLSFFFLYIIQLTRFSIKYSRRMTPVHAY